MEHKDSATTPALTLDDLTAYEQKDRLRVTDLVPFTGNNSGLDLFLLIDDASGSASLGSQLSDLRHFIQTQPETTNIGLGYMHNGTVDILQKCTNDHEAVAKSLRLPLGLGGPSPSPFLSLSELIKEWHGKSARREVVMVSSGIDPLGGVGPINPYLDASIDDAQRAGIVVYTIYMPAAGHAGHSFFLINWGQNHLAELSEETGGEALMSGFSPSIALAPYLNQIAADLQHQYRATVLMKPGAKGSFEPVRFTTELNNASIVSASRVYVPAEGSKRLE
ncbi:MAG TPA: hypothetical protein VHA14_09745 [Bryobacteraceae bacterium]|nr:hypothetical protein [Bryobacteraceae bacterium]